MTMRDINTLKKPSRPDGIYTSHNPPHPKRDVVYCWHYKDDVYKIGITSSSSEHNRIEYLSRSLGVKDPTILLYHVTDNPKQIERRLLLLGEQVKVTSLGGGTEFRRLNDSEIDIIKQIS